MTFYEPKHLLQILTKRLVLGCGRPIGRFAVYYQVTLQALL